jgi:O-antigen/teichoic acid export membrane protein
MRLTFFVLLITQAAVALAAPLVVPFAFGSTFTAAVPLTLILLPAWLLTALTPILSHALAATGYPGPGSVAQVIGLACTVIGLAVSLPTLGATGAALTSLVAAAAVLGYLLIATQRHLAVSLADIARPRTTDVELATTALRAVLGQTRRRQA